MPGLPHVPSSFVPPHPRRLVVAARDIPCLPSNIAALRRVAEAEVVPVPVLEQSIARDVGVTTRVLTAANATYYGCSRQIDSIRGAITLLGVKQIQSIILALVEAEPWECPWSETIGSHGLACALWTRVITRHLKMPDVPYLFSAGLMHDLGLVLMLRKAPDVAATIIEESQRRRRSYLEIEHELLLTDHAALATRACELWKFPERLTRTIAGHHHHEEGNLEGSVLMLADMLSQAIGLGEFPWLPRLGRDEIAASVELNTDIEQLLAQGSQVRAEVEALTGVVF